MTRHMALAALLLISVAVNVSGCGVERDLARGRAAIEARDLGQAEAAWRRAIKKEPDHPEALYGLGWTWHLAGRHDQARLAFERCMEVAPESHLGYKGMGSVELATDDLARARRWFDAALARAPGDPAIVHSLALTHLKEGAPEEALRLYGEVDPDRAGELATTLALGRGEALLRAGRFREALELVDGALAEEPPPQARGMLLVLRARLLVNLTVDRVDPARCHETAQPVLTWLKAAEAAVEEADRLEPRPPDVQAARRLVLRRRHSVFEACPQDGE